MKAGAFTMISRLVRQQPAAKRMYSSAVHRSAVKSDQSEGHLHRAMVATALAATAGFTALFSANSTSQVVSAEQSDDQSEGARRALSLKAFTSFKLKEVQSVSHDTSLFRFELAPDQVLGLDVASCLLTRAPAGVKGDGSPSFTLRPYTPTTETSTRGYFDLVVKKYPDGKMSQHIHSLKPGDSLEMKGPIPKLPYQTNMKKHIGMVAGGTGITPMLQVLKRILHDASDDTQVALVFANKSTQDILLKDQLDVFQQKHPNFHVYYVVDHEEPGWHGGVGHISANILKKALPPPSDDTLILFCGPPGLEKFVAGEKAPDRTQGEVGGLLKELGYTKEQVFKF